MTYQQQFKETAKDEEREAAKEAAEELISRFQPLFKKYVTLITSGHIDFGDSEMKRFVLTFVGDPELKAALKRRRQTAKYRAGISDKFNFVVASYGALPNQEIELDLQMLLMVLAKRYKQMGKNFCAYLKNCFCFEVSRHITKFTRERSNIQYTTIEYEDWMESHEDEAFEECFDDKLYEDTMGIPDMTWVAGESCSDSFQTLDPLERKLLLKYYMEDYNDRQIAEEFSMHINTVNQKRRKAVNKLATAMGVDPKSIRRNRKSGKKALFLSDKI